MYLCNYKTMTTYWNDFSSVISKGEKAIREVYNNIFNNAKEDYKLLTELVMVTNHLGWDLRETKNPMSDYFFELYYETDAYAKMNLKDEELEYFYKITD